jgi:hypothetical protein
MGFREIIGVGVGTKGLWEMEQLIPSMGLVWREVLFLAQRATTPSKGFFFILFSHMCSYMYIICAINMLLVLFMFFSSAG